MGGGAGNGGKKWMRGLSCTSQDKKKGSEGSLGESANRTHWASKHVWVRPCCWNSIQVGMGVGALPTLWLPMVVSFDPPRPSYSHPALFR